MEKDRRFILCSTLIAVLLLVFDVNVMGQFQQPVSFGVRFGKGGVKITSKAVINPSSIPNPGLAGGPSYVKTGTLDYSWHSKTIHAKTDVTTQSIVNAINPKKETDNVPLTKIGSFEKYIPTATLSDDDPRLIHIHRTNLNNPTIETNLHNIDALTDSVANSEPLVTDELSK